jgi:hypothetical protein
MSNSLENRVRNLAKRHGYIIRKSRAGISIDNHGEYMLIEASSIG